MQNDILSRKKIIVGITGCIAAYKSSLLIRELIKRGAKVKVVMTPSALQFITSLTLSTLSKNKVIVNTFPESETEKISAWHIDYALWADLMIIAPATINTIAKIAHGFADNALTTLVSALRSPLLIAPAADVDMYQNKAAQKNLTTLRELGCYIVDAENGELASGLKGLGRLADINKIVDASELILSGYKKDLLDKKILVTAGPTYEDIDPVRFIGNRSSGKMGFQLAKAAFLRGSNVTLISGPSSENSYQEINLIKVRSASEMKKAVVQELKNNEVLIMSAAVADYKSKSISKSKIKKEDNLKDVKLIATDDILSSINLSARLGAEPRAGRRDKNGKIVVGFALETDKEIQNAIKKLKNKNLDIIVLNSLKQKGSGFEYDTNKITIIPKTGKRKDFPLQSKFQAANKILTEIISLLK